MRDLLSGMLFFTALVLIFALAGDLDSMGLVKKTWSTILSAVSQLGDAWREH